MSKAIDLTGTTIGRLYVEKREINDSQGRTQWLCRCECGNVLVVKGGKLRDGNVKSCGCLRREKAAMLNKKHGLTGTRIHNIWTDMKARCYNQKEKQYPNYGGRGIRVCYEWSTDFTKFYEWAMQNGYNSTLTLDRINVDGDYEPSNCRWATAKEQCNNKRNNRLITYKGETKSLMQWSETLGKKYSTLQKRLSRDWTIEKALSTP